MGSKMSQEEITQLEQEERELLEALRLKREAKQALISAENDRKKAEAEALEALKPLEIKINRLQYEQVIIHSKWRADLIDIYKSTPGHTWNRYVPDTKIGINAIPLTSFNEWKRRVDELENINLIYSSPQLIEEINYQINTPPWSFDVAENLKHFTFEMGPRQRPSLLADIDGIKWNENGYGSLKTGIIPLSEGWRIPQCLEQVPGVIFSEAARSIIFHQVEKRIKLDNIAKLEDSDDPRLNVLTRQVFARKHGEKEETWDTFRNHMRPFQRVGVVFALEANGRIMIGDGTGLGKTWELIAYSEIMRLTTKPSWITVFAVKASNIPNWEREIKRLTDLEPITCYNGHWQSKIMGEILKKKFDNEPMYLIVAQETLGTYVELNTPENMALKEEDREVVYLWSDFFRNVLEPDFLGVDEAHQIKNPSTHRSKACRKLASIPHIIPATASPIKNRAQEFWPNLYLVDPLLFQSQQKFLDTYTVNGRYPKNVEKLQELLRPVFLRRTKKQVQKDLPPINRMDRLVRLDEKHQERYDLVMKGFYKVLEAFDPSKKDQDFKEVNGILATYTRLRQICSHYKAESGFTSDLARDLVDESESDHPVCLIFTQWLGIADLISQQLGGEAVCTVRKKTETYINEEGIIVDECFESMDNIERDELFERVRHDKSVKFIITTSAAKEGHNIEYCDWTIFNDHYWTPDDHIQCEGRAYGRLSNPHPIDSFYVIADTEMERIMQQLLMTKAQIIEEAVEGIEFSRENATSMMLELTKILKSSMWRKA